ncbi:hypothetical protein ACFX5E_01340 [Flavobacterium sp. LS2P90]|uniref:Uncharacterized protein n=1 Tax=Flavobacterium xylosi TaxID=3230415 RepID=A0ABW6HTE2_9FLAO
MIKKFITFIFILIANFVLSQDQEATIFFNDGSSIYGFGSINKNNILFRASLDSKPDSWSYDMVKGITFLGFESTVKFEYVSLGEFSKPEPQLLEVVEEGNVTLYARVSKIFQSFAINSNGFNHPNNQFVTNNFVSYRSGIENVAEEIYVKRVNEKHPTSLNSSFYKKAAKYFSDCEVINKKIGIGEFSKNKILELVQYYNDICAE